MEDRATWKVALNLSLGVPSCVFVSPLLCQISIDQMPGISPNLIFRIPGFVATDIIGINNSTIYHSLDI